MNPFLQLWLLIKKNMIMRIRQPGVFILELAWPLLIFLVVAIVRQVVPPNSKPTCTYEPRAMPSAGMAPFLQSFLCNLNNTCHPTPPENNYAGGISALVANLDPYLSKEATRDTLNSLQTSTKLLDTFQQMFSSSNIQELLTGGLVVKNFFKDPGKVKEILLDYMDSDTADAFLNSTVNIAFILDKFGYTDFKEIMCNTTVLQEYLIFKNGTDIELVSNNLCSINESLIPDILSQLQRQIDVGALVEMAADFAKLIGRYDIGNALQDMASVVDMLLGSPLLGDLLAKFPQLASLSGFFHKIPEWFDIINKMKAIDFTTMEDILNNLDPLISKFVPADSTVWPDVRKALHLVGDVAYVISTGKWPALRLSFGDLFPDKNKLNTEVMTFFGNDTQGYSEFMDLLNQQLNSKHLISMLNLTRVLNFEDSLCMPSNLALFLNVDGNKLSSLNTMLQNQLCNIPQFGIMLENLSSLVNGDDILNRLLNPSIDGITQLINEGLDLVQAISGNTEITDMFTKYIGLFERLDIMNMWSSVAGVLNNTGTWLDPVVGLLDSVQVVMEQFSVWQPTAEYLTIADTGLWIVEKSIAVLNGMEMYVEKMSTSDTAFSKFVHQLLSLGPSTTSDVIGVLTSPMSLKDFFTAKSNYSLALCQTHMNQTFPGLMDTDYAALNDLLCSQNATLMIQNIRTDLQIQEIQDAVTRLLADIEDVMTGTPIKLTNASLPAVYVRFVLIPGQLETLMQKPGEWYYLFHNSTVMNNVNFTMTEWDLITSRLMQAFGPTSLFGMLEAWAPLLEDTTFWPTIAPYLRAAEIVIRTLLTQQQMQNNLFFDGSSILSKMMTYVINYGPDIVKAMIQHTDKVYNMFLSGMDSICKNRTLETLPLPAIVPIAKISNFICQTDFSAFVANMTTLPDWTKPTDEIKVMLSTGTGTGKGFHWSMFFSSIHQLMEAYQVPSRPEGNAFSLIFQLDFTHFFVEMHTIFGDLIYNQTDTFQQVVGGLSVMGMSILDSVLDGKPSSVWYVMKRSFSTWLGGVHMMNPLLEKLDSNTLTLDDISFNSSDLRTYLMDVGGLSSEFLDTVLSAVVNPVTFVQRFLAQDFTSKSFCNGLNIQDFLDLPPDSSASKLQDFLCTANWTAIGLEISKSPEIAKVIEIYSFSDDHPASPITLDWAALFGESGRFFQLTSSVITKELNGVLQFPGVNNTATEIKWNELLTELQSFGSMDVIFSRLGESLTEVQALVTDLMLNQNSSTANAILQIMNMATLDQYYIQNILSFANKQLVKFNGTSVNLVDYFKSSQLNKIFDMVEYLPGIVNENFDFLLDMFNNPAKFQILSNMNVTLQLCSNLTVFELILPPQSNSSLDSATLQSLVCNLNFNATVLLQELYSSIDGLEDLVHAFANASQPGFVAPVDYAGMMLTSERFSMLIGDIVRNPPQISIGPNNRWMQASNYVDSWKHFINNMQNLYQNTSMQSNSWMTGFYPLLDMYSMQYANVPDLARIMNTMTFYASSFNDRFTEMLANNASFVGMFDNYPELKHITLLAEDFPEVMGTIFYSVIFHGEKFIALGMSVRSFDQFCSKEPSQFFASLPGSNFNVTAYVNSLCQLNITQLDVEAMEFMGMNSSLALQNTIDGPLNFRKSVDALTQFGETIAQVLNKNPDIWLNRWFMPEEWKPIIDKLALEFQTVDPLMLLAQEWEQYWPYMAAALENVTSPTYNAVINYIETFAINMNTKLNMLAGGEFMSFDFTGYPSMQQLLTLFDELPEITGSLLYTSSLFSSRINILAMQSTSWDSFCALNPASYFTELPGHEFNKTNFFNQLCQVNMTELLQELSTYDWSGFGDVTQIDYKPANLTGAIVAVTDLYTTLTSKVMMPASFSLNMRWTNGSVWLSMIQAYTTEMSTVNITTVLYEELFNMLPYMQQMFANTTFSAYFNAAMRISHFVVDMEIKYLDTATGNISFASLFEGYPQLQQFTELLNWVPEAFGSVIYTVSYDLPKIMVIVNSARSWEDFCIADPNTMFTPLPGSKFNVTMFFGTLCQTNFTSLAAEYNAFSGSDSVIKILNEPGVTANLTAYVMDLMLLNQKIVDLSYQNQFMMNINIRLFDGTIWQAIIQNYTTEMRTTPAMISNLVGMLMTTLGESLAIYQVPGYQQMVGTINTFFKALEVVLDKLDTLPNDTYINVQDFFPDSPEFVKLLRLMDNPDVLEVMLASFNTPKLQQLFALNNATLALIYVCTPSPYSNITDFLTVPAGSNINLEDLKTAFCNISIMDLEGELMNEFNISYIMSTTNAINSTLDLNEIMNVYQRLSDRIIKWLISRPTIVIPAEWQNSTYWVTMLSQYADARKDPQRITEELLLFMNSMRPVMGEAAFNTFGHILQNVLDIVNENLLKVAGQNITLQSLVSSIPLLNETLVSAFGFRPDILEQILNAAIVEPQNFAKLFVTANYKDQLCNSEDKLSSIVSLPSGVNATELQLIFCQIDDVNIAQEIENRIHSLALDFWNFNSSIAPDWAAIFASSNDLTANIENIIQNPPKFDFSDINSIIGKFNTSELSISIKAYEFLSIVLNGTAAGEMFNSYFTSAQAILEFVNNLFKRIQPEGQNINLGSIFKNVTTVQNILELTFNLQPDVVTGLLSVYMRPQKSAEFAAMNSTQMDAVFCSPQGLREFFHFYKEPDVDLIVRTFCHINGTAIVTELMNEFDIPNLINKIETGGTQTLDIESYFKTTQEFVQNIMRLANVTSASFNGVDLNQAFTINTTALSIAMQQMVASMEGDYAAFLTGTLDPLLNQSPNGRTFLLAVAQMEAVLSVIDQKLKEIRAKPVSLMTILGNNTEVIDFIETLLDPRTLDEISAIKVDMSRFASGDPMAALCPNGLLDLLGGGTNSTQLQTLQSQLCAINGSVVADKFMTAVRGYYLQEQFAMLNSEWLNGTLSVDWMSLVNDTTSIMELLQSLITNPPLIDQALTNLLNFTNLSPILQRLIQMLEQEAVTMGGQWFASIMDMVYPMMANTPDGHIANQILGILDAVLDYVNNELRAVEGNPVTLGTIFGNNPDVINLIQTTLSNPDALAKLLAVQLSDAQIKNYFSNTSGGVDVMATVCRSWWNDTLTSGDITDVQAVQDAICSANYTAIQLQLMNRFQAISLVQQMNAMANSSSLKIDWQAHVGKITEMMDLVTRLIQNPPSLDNSLLALFDPTKYANISSTFLNMLNNQNGNIAQQSVEWFTLILEAVWPSIDNTPIGNEISKYVNIANAILSVVDNRLQYFTGQITVNSIAMNNTELADLIQTMFSTGERFTAAIANGEINFKEFLQVLTDPGIRADVCSTGGKMSDYLNINDTALLDDLQKIFCVNETAVVQLLLNVVGYNQLSQQLTDIMMGTAGGIPDFVQLMNTLMNDIGLVTNLLQNPPTINQNLLNFSSLDLDLNKIFSNPSLYVLILETIGPMLDLFNVDQMQLQSVLGVIDQFILIPGTMNMESVTKFANLLMNPTGFNKYILSIVTNEAVLRPQFDALAKFPQIQDVVCNASFTLWNMTSPSASQTMRNALCGQVATNYYDKLVAAGFSTADITSIVYQLYLSIGSDVNMVRPVDWSEFLANIQTLIDAVTLYSNTVANFGSFSMQDYNQIMSNVELMAVNGTVLLLDYFEKLSMPGNVQYWNETKTIMGIVGEVISIINGQLQTIQASGSVIPLIDLLPNVTLVRDALQEIFNPGKVDELLTLGTNPMMFLEATFQSNWPQVACNFDLFTQKFHKTLPQTNITAIQMELCKEAQGNNMFIQKLMSSIAAKEYIDKITAEFQSKGMTGDTWMFVIKQMETLFTNLMSLHNITFIDTTGVGMWFQTMGVMVQNIYSPSINSTLEVFNYLDALNITLITEIRQHMATAMGIVGSMSHYLNQHVFSKLGGIQGGFLNISSIFPNAAETITQLLESIFKPEEAPEILTILSNLTLSIDTTFKNDWETMVCDPVKFQQFKFPKSTDRGKIRLNLCSLIRNNTSFIENAMTTFGLNALIDQVKASLSGRIGEEDVWQYALQEVEKMSNSFMDIPMFMGIDWMSVMQMQTSMTEKLQTFFSSHEQNVDALCNAVTPYIEHTAEYHMMWPMMHYSLIIMEMQVDFIRLMPGFADLLCDLPSLNLMKLGQHLTDTNMWGLINKYMDKWRNPNIYDVKCSDFPRINNEMMIAVNETIMNFMMHPINAKQCFDKFLQGPVSMFNDVNNIFDVIAGLQSIIGNQDLIQLLNMQELHPVFDFVLQVLLQQKAVATSFSSIFANATSIEEMLLQSFSLMPDVVKTLFESTIHLDMVELLNKNASDLRDIICDDKRLSKYMTLPSFSGLKVKDISQQLCHPSILDAIIASVDVTNTMNQIAALGLNSEFLSRLTTHITELISKVDDLKSLQSFYGLLTNMDMSDLNISSFEDVFPQVQKILLQSGPDEVMKSISDILDDFRMLSPNSMLNQVIDGMEVFIKGLMGLDVVKHYIPNILLISDMFPNTAEMKAYMIDTLGISPEVADALMESSISYVALLNLYQQNLTALMCDPAQVSQLLILNTTNDVTLANISAALCTMNASMGERLAEALLKELDIGDLMQQYIQLGGDSFLENAGISKDEAKATFQHLMALSEDLSSIASSLRNLTQNIDVETLSTVAEFQSGAAAMVTLGPLLCGKQVDFVITSELFANAAKRKRRAIDQSAIFCEDFYAQFQAMKNGGIVWKYVKPLILGKILFTPNTTETWKVIQQANSTFQMLVDIKEVADAWSEGVNLLQDLLDKSSSIDSISGVLQSSFVDSLLQQTIGVSGSDVLQSLSTASNFDQRQIQLLEAVTKLISQYVSCVEADRFLAFDSEKDLAAAALELNKNNTVLAGLVFLDMEASTKSQRKVNPKTDLSKHIKYKIRFDLDNVMKTSSTRDLFWRPSPEDSFSLQLRYLRGFLQLQEMVERAVIEIQTETNLSNALSNAPGVYLQEFPFPCHKDDMFLYLISSYLLPLMMTIAWLATLALAIRNLMYDREGGQEEILKVMGLRGGINWMAWFLTTFFFMVLVSIVSAMILKFGDVLKYSNLLILILYLSDFCLSTLMMGYMVSAFFTRGTIAVLTGLIVFLLSYLPFVLLVSFEVQLEFWHKVLASLLSTTGFSYGAIILSRYEQQLIGIQWDNSNSSPAVNDDMSFTWSCIMMLIDSAIYFLIGWYVRNIKPGKYGIAQPWYFPFSPTYWGCKRSSSSSRYETNGIDADDNLLFEKYGQDFPVGIAVQHLSKKYKKKLLAVDNLDMEFYEGQITSILGHNGAGKTTTLNMLTGIVSPSSGTALISNYDIRTDLKKVRRNIGVCPQHNTLFDFMTVEEHLAFCAGIKAGWTGRKLRHEMRSMLKTVDLWHMRHVPARNLSGGMKRRLCIAIAFVGGSQTIILDEPTSGIDPKARRSIWDLILKHRTGRTIILSTHMMEEADILSDRIAVLHHGHLLCSGSPLFLKRQLGSGYRLSMEKALPAPEATCKIEEPSTNGLCNSATVLSFVHRSVPGAILVEEVGTEMTFVLPLQDNTTAGFHHLFQSLDNQMESLHIASYGVSDTTLEEVFLKICALADDGKPLTSEHLKSQRYKPLELDDAQSDDTDSTTESLTTMASKNTLKSGIDLKFQQFCALIVKRFHHFRRNWKMFMTLIFLPCVFFTIAMGLATIQPKTSVNPSLELTPAMYGPNSYTFQQDNVKSDFTDRVFNSMLVDPGLSTTCMASERASHDCVKPGTAFVRPSTFTYKNSTGCKCNDFRQTCDDGASGLIPRQRVTTTTEIMQDLIGRNISDYLLASFDNFTEKRYGGFSFEKESLTGGSEPYLKLWFNNKGWHALPAFSNAYSNAILRSHIDDTTDTPADYGITVYNDPLILGLGQLGVDTLIQKAADTGITLVILLAFTFIPAGLVTYIVNERVSKERQLQQTNGVGIALYWLTCFIWDGFVFMIPVAISAAIIAIFQLSMFWYGRNLSAVMLLLVLYGWSSIPFMYCFLRFFKNSTTAYIVLLCLSLMLGLGTTVTNFLLKMFVSYPNIAEAYNICHYVFMILPQYALGSGLVELKMNQMMTDIMLYFDENVYVDPFSKKMLFWNYVAMAIQGAFFFIVAVVIDACYRARSRLSLAKPEYIKEEEDVSNERRRVESGQNNFDILSVKSLSKGYRRGLKKVLAVDNITFGVPKGECFGLLGINGAGKTTTFKMLTGSTLPSGGSAHLLNRNLISNDDLMRKHVGYCPQFDALDMYLTGREMLTCYAKLKGIPGSVINQMVTNLINRMKLGTHADKIVNTYSGGFRRKLSVAIAFLGDPDILLLDEPTTGMDPGTRRYAWNIISSAIRKQQSVILTSHSMEECDALCSRLAIMVNGRFQCLGSPQHLKYKYSQGYTITIKAHIMTESVANFMQDAFPQAILKEHHNNMLCYTVPRDYCNLASMFALLEHSRHNLHYDYSISQTTLERVFVNFAQDQSDGTVDDSDASSYSETSSTDNSNSLSSQSQRNVAIFNNPIYARGVSLEDVKDMDLKYSDPLQRKKLPTVGIVNPAYDALEFDHSTYL